MSTPVAGLVFRRTRYPIVRAFCRMIVRHILRVPVEGREHLLVGAATYCFKHLNWTDPIVFLAAMPWSPRLALFGPQEEEMSVAINGTSWLGVRRTLRVRIGAPIPVEGRPTAERVSALTSATRQALPALVADVPDPPPPGRFGRWLTELCNDWPEGTRPGAGSAGGPPGRP